MIFVLCLRWALDGLGLFDICVRIREFKGVRVLLQIPLFLPGGVYIFCFGYLSKLVAIKVVVYGAKHCCRLHICSTKLTRKSRFSMSDFVI